MFLKQAEKELLCPDSERHVLLFCKHLRITSYNVCYTKLLRDIRSAEQMWIPGADGVPVHVFVVIQSFCFGRLNVNSLVKQCFRYIRCRKALSAR